MAKAKPSRLFTRVWICLVLTGILGHFLIDIAADGCLLEQRSSCWQETTETSFVSFAAGPASASLPHAGFDLPAPTIFVAAFQLSGLFFLVVAKPAEVSLPIPLPPPR